MGGDTWGGQERHKWGDHEGACCSSSGKRGEDKVLCINGEAELDDEHGELTHSNRRDMGRWAEVLVKARGCSLWIIYRNQLYQTT